MKIIIKIWLTLICLPILRYFGFVNISLFWAWLPFILSLMIFIITLVIWIFIIKNTYRAYDDENDQILL